MSKERSIQTMAIDGNCLCFNFVNTVHSRKENDRFEYLITYKHLMEWCRRLEVMPPDRIKKLSAYASSHNDEADVALNEMISVRELLYRFFSAIAAGESGDIPVPSDFNRYMSQSLAKLHFYSGAKGPRIDWKIGEYDLKEPLWRVMKSAYDILTEESFGRIKECEACGWLFLDLSKNNSRRWCNMQTCGSIHKSKKYYYRKKKEGLS